MGWDVGKFDGGGDRLGKNKLHELRGVQPLFWFSAKFVNISAKFGFLNMQIRNNFKNVVFIACNWCKIFKYYVNTMIMSYSYSQKEEKNLFGLNIWSTLFCCVFKFVVIHMFFPPNLKPKISEFTKKWFFPSLGGELTFWLWLYQGISKHKINLFSLQFLVWTFHFYFILYFTKEKWVN